MGGTADRERQICRWGMAFLAVALQEEGFRRGWVMGFRMLCGRFGPGVYVFVYGYSLARFFRFW
jgi:hypothetical protein